jgi:hypothetical protein
MGNVSEGEGQSGVGDSQVNETNTSDGLPDREVAIRFPAQRTELRFGFTMASLEGLARAAARQSHWRFVPFHEKFEIAWSAIAEELYSSDEPPRTHDLIRLGDKAITSHVETCGHMWGAYYVKPDRGGMPRFEKFWWSQASPTPSPEERIVDYLAFRQIWPRLTKTNQRVLLALAIHGDYQRAAESLNKPYKTFVTQIYEARRQFLRLWHHGERPSQVWGRDRRKGAKPWELGGRSVTAATIRHREYNKRARERQMNAEASDHP